MINFDFIHNSILYYGNLGFKRIESPWLVTEEINDITCPPTAEKYYVKKGDKIKTFVASGEQSFLYLINKGFLPEGNYQTVTPCMRNDNFDQWHTKYFLKNELISFGEHVNNDEMLAIMDKAYHLFLSLGCVNHKLKIVETKEGYDINYCDIEIGSYGIRECEFTKWIYATGLAEPRFSRVLNYGNR